MAEQKIKFTIRMWDAWIKNNILYGVFEIMETNKLVFLEREINDDNNSI